MSAWLGEFCCRFWDCVSENAVDVLIVAVGV